MQTEKISPFPVKMLCLICTRDKKAIAQKVLETHRALFGLASLGKGTANSKILNYLGIGQDEKVVFITIMRANDADNCLASLDAELELFKPAHGIAFTCAIQEGCYHHAVHLPAKEEKQIMNTPANYNMLLVVLNPGYTEEVMQSARTAGATGGTVIHARGVGLKGAEKFFGVTIQPEKEIILIVSAEESRCAIMNEIAKTNGPGSEANAVSFSVPVTDVRGMARLEVEVE